MAFRMKVEDFFLIKEKTIFSGILHADEKIIENDLCAIEIDGDVVGKICIQGEVRTRTPHRDLWTASPTRLTREIIQNHDVWLISDDIRPNQD
jgi:hypothetical protein